MIIEGQIALFGFPQTDQTEAKLRPALVLRRLPGQYNDWLICMISTQLHQKIPDFDEVITPADSDFQQSGLTLASVIRVNRQSNEKEFTAKTSVPSTGATLLKYAALSFGPGETKKVHGFTG